jgi:hypothetical protein
MSTMTARTTASLHTGCAVDPLAEQVGVAVVAAVLAGEMAVGHSAATSDLSGYSAATELIPPVSTHPDISIFSSNRQL